jgi:hypothetical protein
VTANTRSMSTAAPAVRFRLSPGQMSIIWPGLDLICTAHISWRDKKAAEYEFPFIIYPQPPEFDRGTYQPPLMKNILDLWQTLRRIKKVGGRVQMNTIDIRAAILAARLNVELLRKRRHIGRAWSPETKKRLGIDKQAGLEVRAKVTRVIRTLERHMKRANRLLLSEVSRHEFDSLMQLWKAHLRWVRLHLVYLRPWPKTMRGRKTGQQRILDQLVEMAAHGIRSEGYQPPEPRDLRKLMRLYVQYSRRGRVRGDYDLRELRRFPNHFMSKWWLAQFVLDRRPLKRFAP